MDNNKVKTFTATIVEGDVKEALKELDQLVNEFIEAETRYKLIDTKPDQLYCSKNSPQGEPFLSRTILYHSSGF
jgi:hypothetical protein